MAGIQAAVDYAGARNTRALVIGHGGHIVFEKYWDDTTLDTPVDLSGFTPVLSALVLGAAMNDERSINLDAPLGGYIAELGRRSARRDQPASVAHAFERLREDRRLALARHARGAICAERGSASGAARLATRCDAAAG